MVLFLGLNESQVHYYLVRSAISPHPQGGPMVHSDAEAGPIPRQQGPARLVQAQAARGMPGADRRQGTEGPLDEEAA